jgi:hypothetical protein
MRKLLSTILLLLIAAGCKKTPGDGFVSSASFTRTIHGVNPWTWALTNKTDCQLAFTQTWYTGSLTGVTQTRWTLSLSDPPEAGFLTISFPGIDSSSNLNTGKDILLSSRNTQANPAALSGSLLDKGTLYTGSDSAFLDLKLSSFDKKTVTGTFSCLLYSQGTTVSITNGHFAGVPVTLATH